MLNHFENYRRFPSLACGLSASGLRWALILAAWLSLAGTLQAASTAQDVKEGNAFYKKGDFSQALKKYQEALNNVPESPEVNYNAGTANYKAGDFKKAGDLLEKSFLSDNAQLRQKGYFNAGNAFYRFGITQENTSLDDAIKALKRALDYYENSLKLSDKDEDARYNYQFVGKELKRLEEKKKEEKAAGDKSKKEEQQDQQRDKAPDQKNEGQPRPSPSPAAEEDQKKKASEKPDNPQNDQDKQEDAQQNNDIADKGKSVPSPKAGEMTKEESEMLLDEYRRQEEPQGLLNFIKRKGRESPVLKDW